MCDIEVSDPGIITGFFERKNNWLYPPFFLRRESHWERIRQDERKFINSEYIKPDYRYHAHIA